MSVASTSSFSLPDEIWKQIVALAQDMDRGKDYYTVCTHSRILMNISMLCKSGANFVKTLWLHDRDVFAFYAENSYIKHPEDAFNSRFSGKTPFNSLILSSKHAELYDLKSTRALSILATTTTCSVCHCNMQSDALTRSFFLRKVLCGKCKQDIFISYKDLYLRSGVDLSITFSLPQGKKKRKAEASLDEPKYKKKKTSLLEYYFQSGGFALRYPVTLGTVRGESAENINGSFTPDQFSNIFFNGPTLIFLKKDIYRILNIGEFHNQKKLREASGELVSSAFKRKLVELRLRDILSSGEFKATVNFTKDDSSAKEAWKRGIIRDRAFSLLSDKQKQYFYRKLKFIGLSDARYAATKIQYARKTISDCYGLTKTLVDVPNGKKLDQLGKKYHNIAKALKEPGPRLTEAMELWCSKILNHGFAMSSSEYLKKMRALMDSMAAHYMHHTWAIC